MKKADKTTVCQLFLVLAGADFYLCLHKHGLQIHNIEYQSSYNTFKISIFENNEVESMHS